MNVRAIALAVVAAVTASIATRCFTPTPAPGPAKAVTDTVYLERQRPDLVKPSLGQKLTTRKVSGQTTIADAPSAPSRLSVASYCAPQVEIAKLRNSVISDSSASNEVANQRHTPALLPDFRGRRAGPRLELYSTLGDGRRWQWTGTARGRVTWQSSGDSVLVRGDRLWVRVLRGTPRCASYGAAGGAIGLLAGQDQRQAALTGLVTALACAF